MLATMSINTAFSADFNIFDEARKLGMFQQSAMENDPEYQALNSLIPSGGAIIGATIAMAASNPSATVVDIQLEMTRKAFLELKGSTEFDTELLERFETLDSEYKSSTTEDMLSLCHAVWNNPNVSQNYQRISATRKVQENIEFELKIISVTEQLKMEFGAALTLAFVDEMRNFYPLGYLQQNWPAVIA